MFVQVKQIQGRSIPAYMKAYPQTGAILIANTWRELLDAWSTNDPYNELYHGGLYAGDEFGRRIVDMLDNAADDSVVVRYMVAEKSDAGNVGDELALFLPSQLASVQVPETPATINAGGN